MTVGTQLPFDRLVGVVDQWCGQHPSIRVHAQVGDTSLQIKHMEYERFVPPDKANKLFREASLIVAHAGMGSVLTALRYRKPILILPRRLSLAEVRNDHQLATAKWLVGHPGIRVAWEESEIGGCLDCHSSIPGGTEISAYASPELTDHLRTFIAG
jgi:UDP-N-acetylglucosamine transferase subunit ALG13